MLERVWKSKSLLVPSQPKQEKKKGLLLPGDLSGRILDLQMQCQKESIAKQTIFELVSYYTKAVEFYEQNGDQKYKQYQKRMHKFLQKPVVQSILRGESGQMILKKQKAQQTVRNAESKAQRQVKKIIENSEKQYIQQQNKVKEQIQKQEVKLQERKRKRTMSNRSFNSRKSFSMQNEESGKKQQMNMKLLLEGINERTRTNSRRVYF